MPCACASFVSPALALSSRPVERNLRPPRIEPIRTGANASPSGTAAVTAAAERIYDATHQIKKVMPNISNLPSVDCTTHRRMDPLRANDTLSVPSSPCLAGRGGNVRVVQRATRAMKSRLHDRLIDWRVKCPGSTDGILADYDYPTSSTPLDAIGPDRMGSMRHRAANRLVAARRRRSDTARGPIARLRGLQGRCRLARRRRAWRLV